VLTADLLVHDAELIATVDDARREIAGGWIAVTDGVVSAAPASRCRRPRGGWTPAAAWSPRGW
jgi:hypothetical protein